MRKIFTVGFVFITNFLLAQYNTVSSGGNATGIEGTVSYSIGQVFYNMNINTNFSTLEGIQQPIEIIPLKIEDVDLFKSNIIIYPNPVQSEFSILFSGEDYLESQYQLLDLGGKSIQSTKIVSAQTTVIVEQLPTAVYLLKVTTPTSKILFKIIKQ